jgi:conjugative transposon TraM protein
MEQKTTNSADTSVKSAPKKELTTAEMQRRKKMLVLPLFFLIFAAAMWLIFAPSGSKDKEVAGLNMELPMPKDDGLVSDKRDAYRQEAMQLKQQERMRSLQDFAYELEQAQELSEEEQGNEWRIAAKPVEDYEETTRLEREETSRSANIHSSAYAHQDINRQLGTWYEQPATEVDEQSQLAVQWRLQELERKLEEVEQRKAEEDEQTALLEKSYRLAVKYMPQQAGQTTTETIIDDTGKSVTPQAGQTGKAIVQPVRQVRKNVVSLLSGAMDDEEFIAIYSQPRNIGFLTAAGNEGAASKNTIQACVYNTVTLTNGQELQIRLLEPMQVGNILIPANTVITGTCRITGERLDIAINSIHYAGNIIPVELLVYDTDGQRGVSVPNSAEINTANEVASRLASSAGTSIMISDNAGSQLAADMGKGLIQGASQYVSKKLSVVKVTLKANHQLMLLPNTN